jgi:phage terminase small subunit
LGRPPKSHLQLVAEKKSHRTKAELETREKAEKALMTGSSLQEWPDIKAKAVAHREFNRLKNLLAAIGQDDALHEAVINRYCLLLAECKDFENLKIQFAKDIKELGKRLKSRDLDYLEYIDRKGSLQDRLMACDRKIMDKRKMLLQIEKENLLTIASALRAIPKKPPEEEEDDQMASLLNRKSRGG